MESKLYDKLKENNVRCNVCLRRCTITDGLAGFCMTRDNRHGTLYSTIYGEVSSLSINPIEKKPVYHFYPGSRWLSVGSVGCNFRCPGCQNWSISQWMGGPMYAQHISPERLVLEAEAAGCKGISWTFNEPTLWLEYTLDAAKLAKARGLCTNYVTNGFITEDAFDMIAPFLDVYRVDIKGFSDETYRKVTGVKGFEGILNNAKRAKDYGMHVEIVTNIVPGLNDDVAELKGLASWIKEKLGPDTPWHVTGFHPHHELVHLEPTPMTTLERAWSSGKEVGLHYVYLGNVPGHEKENTFCHSCGRLLIVRDVFDVIKDDIKAGHCPECCAQIPGRFEV